MQDITWTQPSLFTDDTVTEVTIRLGMVGKAHAQWQIEARDETGALVAMVSQWSFDLSELHIACTRLTRELEQLRASRHAPF